jgi:hypothetical protein
MCVRDLKVNASDPVPLAIAKMVAREALRGKVQAAAELANRIEGTPTQRHELGGPDGLAMKVEAKVSIGDLFGAIRTIYGLEEEAK